MGINQVADTVIPQTAERSSADDDDLIQVVAEARAGTSEAWETLVERFGGLVAAVARRCRLSEADVAEVGQTTWLRLVENIDRIQQPERLGAWLATTSRREASESRPGRPPFLRPMQSSSSLTTERTLSMPAF